MKSQDVTSTSTNHTSIPDWLTNASLFNINYAQNLPQFVPYTGQGVAPLTGNQTSAINLAQGNAGQGQAIIAPAVGGAVNAMNFTAPMLTGEGIGADVQGLLGPYQNTVVRGLWDTIDRQRQQQNNALNATAARAHAFGGDRAAIVEAANNRDFNTMGTNATASLLDSNWRTALGTALGIGQGNQNAALAAGNLNLAGANALPGIGSAYQGAGTNDINTLLGTGGVEYNVNQNNNIFNYQEFLRQLQSQYQFLQGNITAAASAPHDTTSNTTSTQPVFSNPLAGIAGLGLMMAGMPGLGAGFGLLGGAAGGGGGGH